MFSCNLLAAAMLACAGTAMAADSSCSSSSGLTVQNQGDADSISECSTFNGNINIAPQTAGPISFGCSQISGNLNVQGATNMTALSFPKLQSIGDLSINNCQMLSTLSAPNLQSAGDVSLLSLPNLNTMTFAPTSLKSLTIGNTFLNSVNMTGLQKVQSLEISNNRMLPSVSFQMSAILGDINIAANGGGDNFHVDFPNLQTCRNITIRSASDVNIPSFQNATGNFGLYGCSVNTFSANNLTSCGQTFAVNGNPSLTNISVPILKNVGGGFQVQNNTDLTNFTAPSLKTISGAFDCFGNFNSVDLPALQDVRGGFNLQSKGPVDCGRYQNESGSSKVIKGAFHCVASTSSPGNATHNPGSGTKGAAALVSTPNISLLIGLASLLAGLMSTL